MKFLNLLIALILSSTCLYTQTVDEILKKTEEALGYQNYQAVKTSMIQMTMTMMGIEFTMKTYKEKPNKIRLEMNVMGQNIISVISENEGWVSQNGVVQDIPQDQMEEFQKRTTQQGGLFDLMMEELSEKNKNNITFIGKEKVDGKDHFKLRTTDEEGKDSYIFIDGKTYLITKIVGRQDVMGSGEQDVEILFKKYKEFNNFKIPTLFEMTADGEVFGEMTIDKAEFDQPIDPALFQKP